MYPMFKFSLYLPIIPHYSCQLSYCFPAFILKSQCKGHLLHAASFDLPTLL